MLHENRQPKELLTSKPNTFKSKIKVSYELEMYAYAVGPDGCRIVEFNIKSQSFVENNILWCEPDESMLWEHT